MNKKVDDWVIVVIVILAALLIANLLVSGSIFAFITSILSSKSPDSQENVYLAPDIAGPPQECFRFRVAVTTGVATANGLVDYDALSEEACQNALDNHWTPEGVQGACEFGELMNRCGGGDNICNPTGQTGGECSFSGFIDQVITPGLCDLPQESATGEISPAYCTCTVEEWCSCLCAPH